MGKLNREGLIQNFGSEGRGLFEKGQRGELYRALTVSHSSP